MALVDIRLLDHVVVAATESKTSVPEWAVTLRSGGRNHFGGSGSADVRSGYPLVREAFSERVDK
jgi:hypothetical protein